MCAGDVAEKIDVYNIDSNLKVHSPVLVMVSVIFDRDYRNIATPPIVITSIDIDTDWGPYSPSMSNERRATAISPIQVGKN